MSEDCPRDTTCVFKTSTILISTAREKRVYRSLREMPEGLRSRLLKSTRGPNCGSIVIADRRGRAELARAVGVLPSSWGRTAAAARPETARPRKRVPTRRLLASGVLALTLLCLALLFYAGS
ncbi:MAG: hypothetical protein ACE15B_10750 [Bryobacteraceae bacterium]